MASKRYGYSSSDIKETTWGSVRDLGDGRWETVWQLTFKSLRPLGNVGVFRSDDGSFCAELRMTGSTSGELRVTTKSDAMAAENYSPTYASFRIINDEYGEIETIETQLKDWYPPFRNRGDAG
ncbi:hypothetical protein ACFO5K_10740 [Nocardia halotolerans]|uniref:Uncharacterized protein n=1 Tax=Nocardia halotolerans TaxID=1755878 RepID=A0ABV8VGU2_9NOCA